MHIVRFLVCVVAAAIFAYAGFQMTDLHSQAGNTIAELFDQDMGYFSFGMAVLSLGIGIPAIMPQPAPTTAVPTVAPSMMAPPPPEA